MILLISIEDFKTYGIQLPSEQSLDDWERYINEAQEFDIRPNLGDLLYYDLLKNPTAANYTDLLNGVDDYTFNNYSYRYPGLKAAICYFAYARYLPDSNKKNTDFGMMTKKNEYSDHVDSKFIQVLVNNALSAGKGFMEQSRQYLTRYATIDPAKFPLWGQFVGCASPSHSSIRISKIGQVPGTESNYGYNGRFSDGIDRREY